MAGLNHGERRCDRQILQASAMGMTQHVIVHVEAKILKRRVGRSVVERCGMKGRIAECEVGGIASVTREHIGQADFYIKVIGEAIVDAKDHARGAALTHSKRTCRTRAHLVSKVIVVAIEEVTLQRHFDRAVTFRRKPSLCKQGGRGSHESCAQDQQEPGKSLRTIHAGYFFANSLVSSRLVFISIASSRTDR